MRRVRLALCALLFLVPMAPAPALRADELLVFAASSLTDVLRKIGASWERETGDRIAFSFAGSSTLARQIEAGAPADLFVSADVAKIEQLDRKNLLLPGVRREICSNRLVVIASNAIDENSPKSLADLAGPAIGRLALAEPETVPAGIYARTALRRAGVWDAVAARVVPTASVRAALAAADAGDVDAAIVFATDARLAKRARIAFEVPHELTPRIAYVAAVTRASPAAEKAKRFLDFLVDAPAANLLRGEGFVVAPNGGPVGGPAGRGGRGR